MRDATTEDEAHSAFRSGATAVLLVSGRLDGVEVPLRLIRVAGEVRIGRGGVAALGECWRLDSPAVSRRHARISSGEAGVFVEDVGSRNGTWVDGAILRGDRAPLTTGTVIVLGGEVAVLRWLRAEQIDAVTADQEQPLGPVVTASAALALALRRLRVLAPTDVPILLAGETGVGKEVYARAVHQLSGRTGAFVAINCASFQRDLLESHLFGYKRGSHSQASEDHSGILSTAEGGTLFLDEIGEMDRSVQTKLLRFLQDRTFFGLGAARAKQADVRIIAATQWPEGTLRSDILGRLGADAITLPPLRDRREDLPALCRYFVRRLPSELGVQAFGKDVAYAFCSYPWPRNVRELEAAILEAALSAQAAGASSIGLSDLPRGIGDFVVPGGRDEKEAPVDPGPSSSGKSVRPTRAELENLLRQHGGRVPAVARHLQRRREQVWRWCQFHEIDPQAYRTQSQSRARRHGVRGRT
jgi:transcriptional regulator with PAS, ATPase and Fis domain